MNEPIFCGDAPTRDTRRVRIVPRRPMFLKIHGQDQLQPVAAGEAVAVEKWTLAGIDPADFEVVEVHPPSIEDHTAP